MNIKYLKDYPHNLTKDEINGTWKIPASQLFSELTKIWKCNLGLYSKDPIFNFIHDFVKIEKFS